MTPDVFGRLLSGNVQALLDALKGGAPRLRISVVDLTLTTKTTTLDDIGGAYNLRGTGRREVRLRMSAHTAGTGGALILRVFHPLNVVFLNGRFPGDLEPEWTTEPGGYDIVTAVKLDQSPRWDLAMTPGYKP